MSDVQHYIEYITKKHETLTTIPPICVYIKRINNRLVIKTKDGCKLELQTPETMQLSSSTKINRQNKNREKVPSFEVAEVVLVQCIIHFYAQQILYLLLNVELSNSVFLETYNTEFDENIIKFTDQNGRR